LVQEAPEAREDARPTSLLTDLTAQLTESPDLVELISRAIVDEPPLAVKEGGMIRDGFSTDLDELRNAQRGGKDWLAKLQQDEIERTGISSLKVRFNSVFGYYIEVTKSNLDKVPPHYIRKQTVANGERFITPELKDMEGKILGAEERSVKAGIRTLPTPPRRSPRPARDDPANRFRPRATRRARLLRRNRAPARLLPPARRRRRRAANHRWPASGAGAKFGGRALRAE
jgi:hypothetical protein